MIKTKYYYIFLIISLGIPGMSYSQYDSIIRDDTNFFSIIKKVSEYRAKQTEKEIKESEKGEKDNSKSENEKEDIYGQWEWFWRSRVDEHGGFSKYGEEMRKILKKPAGSRLKSASSMSITWTPIGPSSTPIPCSGHENYNGIGRVTSIWANSKSNVYIGAEGGGFWKWDGLSWTNFTDYYPVFGANNIAFGKNIFNVNYIAFTEPDPDGNSYQPAAGREVFIGIKTSF
jgi:hypothetical protein